jgi:ribose/xylose/arabinose/galactoside ABC-type transport system permease subunit
MGGEIDQAYSQSDGRKIVYASLNPVDLLRNPNKFTVIALAVILVLVLIVVLIIRAVTGRHRRAKGKNRAAPGYDAYRGR